MAEGFVGMSARVQAAKQRRDELTQAMERARESRQAAPAQGPAQRIERPALAQPTQGPSRPIERPRMRVENPPPLPTTMPAVTPVADLKNKTAMNNRLTPEASRDLYNTPVRVRYTQDDSGIQGHYENRNPIASYVREKVGLDDPYRVHVDQYPSSEDAQATLMHEYAHKWHNENMPSSTYGQWNILNPVVATDYAKERVDRDYAGSLHLPSAERYATATETGPWGIPADVRRAYYPFYREDIGERPQPSIAAAPQVEPMPDLASMRERYFSPQQWVPEKGTMGYYADGTPVRKPFPIIDLLQEGHKARQAQDAHYARELASQRPVPKPPTMPQVTPVSFEKNKVALGMKYTDDASRLLYNTPTRIRYGDFATHTRDPRSPVLGSRGVAGVYVSPEYTEWFPDTGEGIYVTGQNEWNPTTGTLAHEFAHKWYDERMPPDIKYEWQHNYPQVGDPWAVERARGYADPMADTPNETYAFSAMNDMHRMDDEVRNRYYAGLFEGDQTEWDKVQYLPLPPVLTDEVQRWGAPNWKVPPTSDILREQIPWYSADGLQG